MRLMLRVWLSRVLGLFGCRWRDEDLADDIDAHLDLLAAEHRRRGLSPADAAAAARCEFGGIEPMKEVYRDRRGLPWLGELVRDLRYGGRSLVRTPGLTVVAVLSLALGIGLNTAIFSLADAVLLHPLPVRDPARVVTVSTPAANDRKGPLSYPNYRDLREETRSFDGLVAYQRSRFSFGRSREAVREMRLGVLASGNFFRALDVQPVQGRAFAPSEGAVPGRDAVVVLGYDFWKRALAADGSILNSAVWIDGIPFTVIGIAPASFTGMDPYIRPAFYVPIAMAQALGDASTTVEDRAARQFVVKGRLKAGVSREEAQAELTTLWSRLERQYPDANGARTLAVRTELQSRIQSDPPTAIAMGLLLALVSIVLLIACANVASLMLGRARGRGREVAIRLAMGVSRLRLFVQLFAESALLACVGGAFGLGVAYGGIRLLRTFHVPTDLPIVIAPQLNGRVLGFSVAAAALSAILFGVTPAWQSLKLELVPALKDVEMGPAAHHRTRGRDLLVMSEVAFAMTLLVATGMLLDGARKELRLDPGFRTDHLVMASTDTSVLKETPRQAHDFYQRLLDGAQTLPGVTSAALTSAVPLDPDAGGSVKAIIPEGYQLPKGQESVPVSTASVTPSYFNALGIEILQGRAFNADDRRDSRRVAIVNEEFVRTYWPGQDPIGRRIQLDDRRGPFLEVVGVAKTGKYHAVTEAPTRFLYLPFAQDERPAMSLILETTSADPAVAAERLRELVRRVDARQPIYNLRSMASFYQQWALAPVLFLMEAVTAMGLLGLALALIGLYGLVGYSVSRRTREIGIRMAVGASPSDILGLVVRQGLQLASTGILVGSLTSFVVARGLSTVLVGLGPTSGIIYVIVPLALLGLTTVAAYLPARRASHVDPAVALRAE